MLLSTLCVLAVTFLLTNAQTVYYNCPEGWITDLGNKRCYNFVTFPKLPYVLAARACAELYSSLVSVTSVSEQSFLNDYLLTTDTSRHQWYTSGRKVASNSYTWEGEGTSLNPAYNYWINGYQFITRGDRIIYQYDTNQNGYRWTIGLDTIKRAYICEIGQEEAYRVLIQKRDFTFGTPFMIHTDTSYGPNFVSDGEPENVWFLTSSKSLYMECLAIGNPQPSYRWLRGPTKDNIAEVVKTETDSRYTLTNGKLTIQNPDNRDTEFYRCEAYNTQGRIVSNYAQLSLGKLGEFSNNNPGAVTAEAYEGFMIDCLKINKINYEPAIVFNWERITGGTPQDIFTETTPYVFISTNGKLYFSEVTKNDAGDYYCRVTLSGISKHVVGTSNAPSATSRPMKVNVNPNAAKGDWGPIIHNDFINAYPNPPVRGQDVRLECFAYGSQQQYKQKWNFIWSREGGLPAKIQFEDLNRILILPNAQAEDEGVYTCLVKMGSGSDTKSFTLSLNTKPYFLMDLKHQHIDIGSQFTWQCLADGNPSPQYSWFRNGTMILANDPNVQIRKNILTIASADPLKHNGMYQCGAANVLGQVLSSAQLRVLEFAPSFDKYPLPKSLSGAVKGNISIECRPEAAPRPDIKWSRRDNFGNIAELTVSVITSTNPDTTARFQMTLNGDLVISDIQQVDEGAYICTATNVYGEDQSACELRVETGTTLFRKPDLVYREVQNSTVFMQCEASYDPDLDLIYVWKFNGKRIDMVKESYFFTQSYNPVGLYIKPIQYYHAGEYECTALTPLNSESASGRLYVEGFPEAPAGVYADSGRITTNSIKLYWTAGNDRGSAILEYEVMYNVKSEPGKWFIATPTNQRIFHIDTAMQDSQDTSKRTYTLTSLLPWNEYIFKIRAKNIKGWGTYSLPSSGYTTFPAAPDINYNRVSLNLTGGGGSVGDLTIKWNPLPRKYHGGPGLYYRIYWRRTNTEVWSAKNVPSNEVDLTKGQLMNVELVGDENYYLPYTVMIQPNNELGKGDNSTKKIIYSAEGMPVPSPKISHCNAVNATAMRVFWTPIDNTRKSVGGLVAGFQVNYWPKPKPTDTLPIYKRFIRFSTINGVIPESGVVIGLVYDSYSVFDVQVFNTAGLGPKSDNYPCETASWPTIHYPTEINVHAVDSKSIRMTWRGVTIETAEATIIGYKIFVWPSNEDFYQARQYIANFMPTEYTLQNLKQGIVYSTRIAAYSQGGDGQKSRTVHFLITGGPATLIDQTVTEFSFLAAPSLSSSIVLLVLTSILVFLLSQ